MIDTTLLFQPGEPFSEKFQAPPKLCELCRRSINAHCSVHLPSCPYSCNHDQIGLSVSDSIMPMLTILCFYFISKIRRK